MRQRILWVISAFWVVVLGFGLFITLSGQNTTSISGAANYSGGSQGATDATGAAGGQAIQGSASGIDLQGSDTRGQIQDPGSIQDSNAVELLLDN